MKKVLIINGPNLNLLGKREIEIYGTKTFEDFFNDIQAVFSASVQLKYFQSNIEGEIVDQLQKHGFDYDGILLNAGGYTHTSVAILDAIKAIDTPVIEIHISNVYAREDFRRVSLLAEACKGLIAGFGLESYILGLDSLLTD